MAFTGYRIYPTLKKVTDDVNEYPLDINNELCSISGLPQATMANPEGSPTYRVLDPTCNQFSFVRQQDFQRNDCTGEGYYGSIVTFSKTYYSAVSPEDAEAIANADTSYTLQGQTYANENGICNPPLPSDAVGIVVIDMYGNTDMDVCCFIDTPGASAVYQKPVYKGGSNFYPNDGTAAKNCWLLASDNVGGSPLAYRFEVNVARLLTEYPAQPQFVIKIRGRKTTAGTNDGLYALKGAEVGNMTMNGSPGTYVPSTSSTNNLTTVNYFNKAVPSGANGSIGLAYGSDILVFTYNVAAKTLTLA